MSNASWDDAEAYCNYIGGHLWGINSFYEWWNLYISFSVGVVSSQEHRPDININFRYLASTVLLFIGLQKQNEKMRKVIQLSLTL